VIVAALYDPDERGVADTVGNVVIFAAIWALGRAVRARQQRADELEVTARDHEERPAGAPPRSGRGSRASSTT
jgi:hypothetical protein